jgi:hypothetical protein
MLHAAQAISLSFTHLWCSGWSARQVCARCWRAVVSLLTLQASWAARQVVCVLVQVRHTCASHLAQCALPRPAAPATAVIVKQRVHAVGCLCCGCNCAPEPASQPVLCCRQRLVLQCHHDLGCLHLVVTVVLSRVTIHLQGSMPGMR